MNRQESDIVSATEIASWAWCPESWRLNALGHPPGNRDALARGERFHTRQAAYERRTRILNWVGQRLVLLGLVMALGAILLGVAPVTVALVLLGLSLALLGLVLVTGSARELAGEGLWTVSNDKPLALGLPPDPRAARLWGELAAAQEDSNGLLVMAQAYVNDGAFDRALESCRKAAASNHPGAFLLESKWYASGDTVHPKDPTKAYQLGKRAADMGYASGQVWIGALYADHDVPKDQFVPTQQGPTSMHHALHYWTLAAEQHDETAKRFIHEAAANIRANPDAGYWEQFQRAYPAEVAKFRYHSGGQLSVKEPEAGEFPPNGGPAFGVVVIKYNGPGVLVSQVIPRSPAQAIGLEVGDVILQIDGQIVNSPDEVVRAIKAAGATIKVVVRDVRDGSKYSKSATLNK